MRCIAAILVLVLSSLAQQHSTAQPRITTPAQLHWEASDIPGLEMAIVSGNPDSEGPFVLRLRARRQVSIPAHWHTSDEYVTVLAGSPAIGIGDQFKTSALRTLHPGDHIAMPAQTRHFALFRAGTIVQVQANGPATRNWVAPNSLKTPKSHDVDSASDRTKSKAEQDKR